MRYLLLAIALVPLFPTIATAQSWQDWSRQNPTYGSPAPEVAPSTPPSPTRPAPARRPMRAPAQPIITIRSPEFKNEFMRGCLASAGAHQKAYCACAVQKIQDNFTTEEFVQQVQQYQQTGMMQSPLVEKAMRPCFTHIVR